MEKIVADIMFDMETKDRLAEVVMVMLCWFLEAFIEACKYYELFQNSGLKKCAIITSYVPHTSDIKGESIEEDERTDKHQKV